MLQLCCFFISSDYRKAKKMKVQNINRIKKTQLIVGQLLLSATRTLSHLKNEPKIIHDEESEQQSFACMNPNGGWATGSAGASSACNGLYTYSDLHQLRYGFLFLF